MRLSLCPYSIQIGPKCISGFLLRDGRVRLLCDCDVFPDACVQVFVTQAQADELVSRAERRRESKLLQDILPDQPAAIREIFISGTTPAEWDAIFHGVTKPIEQYGCYKYDDENA